LKVEYTKELLEEIVEKVYTFSDVCRELGLHPHSGNIKTIHRKIDEYQLDISHFNRSKSSISKPPPTSGSPVYTLEEILVENSTYTNTNCLRKRLIKEGLKPEKCEICGNNMWLGKPLSLQLHHINGVRSDNRLENLQILCPNCHSQTDNYGSKNISK
jgi:5-methylcytosine-specific restriction endonuclease McrA